MGDFYMRPLHFLVNRLHYILPASTPLDAALAPPSPTRTAGLYLHCCVKKVTRATQMVVSAINQGLVSVYSVENLSSSTSP